MSECVCVCEFVCVCACLFACVCVLVSVCVIMCVFDAKMEEDEGESGTKFTFFSPPGIL